MEFDRQMLAALILPDNRQEEPSSTKKFKIDSGPFRDTVNMDIYFCDKFQKEQLTKNTTSKPCASAIATWTEGESVIAMIVVFKQVPSRLFF